MERNTAAQIYPLVQQRPQGHSEVLCGLLQQGVELALHFTQPAADISQADGLSRHRRQLHLHCSGNLSSQLLSVGHWRSGGPDCHNPPIWHPRTQVQVGCSWWHYSLHLRRQAGRGAIIIHTQDRTIRKRHFSEQQLL